MSTLRKAILFTEARQNNMPASNQRIEEDPFENEPFTSNEQQRKKKQRHQSHQRDSFGKVDI